MRVGRQNISVNLTGQLTHWTQGATTAFFGAGIVVSSLTINSATSATALLNINLAEPATIRDATLTTGAEVVTLHNGFTVNAGPPVIITARPPVAQQGQT